MRAHPLTKGGQRWGNVCAESGAVDFRHSFDDNDNDDHDDADDNEAPSESSSHAGMGVEQLSANGGGGGMGEALRPIFVTYYVPGAVFVG